MTKITESPFMKIALEEAEKAFERDEVPVGTVIIDRESQQIISVAGNMVEETNDPTAHAEIIAIRKACKVIKDKRVRLSDCSIYVTLEPCPMCAQAISFARIHSLYYGASDIKGGGVENGARIFNSSSCHHRPEIYNAIAEDSCSKILKDFFKKKRI